VNGWQAAHRRLGVYWTARRKTDHAARQAIVDGYAAGSSLAALARGHGLSVATVRKTLRDAGVELRPNYRHNPFGGSS
jgi:DNA invertase Pin-like site-specific DNA recombinase